MGGGELGGAHPVRSDEGLTSVRHAQVQLPVPRAHHLSNALQAPGLDTVGRCCDLKVQAHHYVSHVVRVVLVGLPATKLSLVGRGFELEHVRTRGQESSSLQLRRASKVLACSLYTGMSSALSPLTGSRNPSIPCLIHKMAAVRAFALQCLTTPTADSAASPRKNSWVTCGARQSTV